MFRCKGKRFFSLLSVTHLLKNGLTSLQHRSKKQRRVDTFSRVKVSNRTGQQGTCLVFQRNKRTFCFICEDNFLVCETRHLSSPRASSDWASSKGIPGSGDAPETRACSPGFVLNIYVNYCYPETAMCSLFLSMQGMEVDVRKEKQHVATNSWAWWKIVFVVSANCDHLWKLFSFLEQSSRICVAFLR